MSDRWSALHCLCTNFIVVRSNECQYTQRTEFVPTPTLPPPTPTTTTPPIHHLPSIVHIIMCYSGIVNHLSLYLAHRHISVLYTTISAVPPTILCPYYAAQHRTRGAVYKFVPQHLPTSVLCQLSGSSQYLRALGLQPNKYIPIYIASQWIIARLRAFRGDLINRPGPLEDQIGLLCIYRSPVTVYRGRAAL